MLLDYPYPPNEARMLLKTVQSTVKDEENFDWNLRKVIDVERTSHGHIQFTVKKV